MHIEQGSGQPIVLVHGNLSNRETWRNVLSLMPESLRAIAYDLRGHSRSARMFGDPGIADFVTDLDELRRECALSPMILVGQSFGAYIAAAYAARFPEQVCGLLLIAAPASRSAAERRMAQELVARFRTEGVATVMKGLVSAWYSDEFRELNPSAIDQRLEQIQNLDPSVSIKTYELYNNFELAEIASDILCPTIVMTGEFARGCGADSARALAQKIKLATSTVLPRLKNGLPTEAPGAIVASIRKIASACSTGERFED